MAVRATSAATAAFIVAIAGCASVDVRTVKNPDANLGALRTFNVMQQPSPATPAADAANDPILVNPVTARALRADLLKGFENRGYTVSDAPDFVVAYHAYAKDKPEVAYWDYGYPYYPGWWGPWGPRWGPSGPVTEYTEWTVIIDVLNPTTKELLWRGGGARRVSNDGSGYDEDLSKTVTAILDKFPTAPQGARPQASAPAPESGRFTQSTAHTSSAAR